MDAAVIFFGSPGIGTSDAGDLKVPSDMLSNSKADGDWAAKSGLFGGNPDRNPDITQLETGAATNTYGESLSGSDGHSEYQVNGSTSQWNNAAAIAGHPEDRIKR